MTLANEIINQLGGNKFQVMTGARLFVATEHGVQFSFPGCHTTNKCRVTLQGDDTYTMEFYQYNLVKVTCELVKRISMVYGDQLQDVFQNTTGLVTHL
jgi:hypothetical protein